MICPRCGAQANGKFCASCGAKLQQQCAACGAQLAANDKFCGECGAPAPSPSPDGQKSSSVTIGDIGVMRGTIDQSTHTSIGAQTNISGDLHVQMTGKREPTYAELMTQGRQSLSARLYPQARDAFSRATQLDTQRADAYFYLALATLQGKRPKLVNLATARAVEQMLQTAVACDRACSHAYLLWALVKEDAYALNGIAQRPPTAKEILVHVRSVEIDKVIDITDHLQAPGNQIWEGIRR
jgi:hypothetical protein